jgi:hypothetical protein
MKVWLPIFPREGDHGLNFMSKRIMLHFPIEKFYPLGNTGKPFKISNIFCQLEAFYFQQFCSKMLLY